MGYLATEIIVLLAGAAVLGLIVGWALFGLSARRQGAPAGSNPRIESELKAEREARKKAEGRVNELEAKAKTFNERLQERDTKVAELSHQLDELSKYRVQSAGDMGGKDQRIAQLEGELRQRDEELQRLSPVPDAAEQITKLKAELDAVLATQSPDARRLRELEHENAELRETLVATAGAAPTTSSEKDGIIARLNEEVTGLRAAYESAEQALDEQDAAIDKLTRDLQAAQHKLQQAGLPNDTPAAAKPPSPPPQPPPPFKPVPPTLTERHDPSATLVGRLPTPAPKGAVASEDATAAISLADLVDQIDKKAAPPSMPADAGASSAVAAKPAEPPPPPKPEPKEAVKPPPLPAEISQTEATTALSLDQLVAQIEGGDGNGDKSTAPKQVEANESTVALSLADLVGEIDDEAKLAVAPAPAGALDDLKEIRGIGPATEKRLNKAGILTWSQMAGLSEDDLAAVADLLKISVDKIKREQWVEQARALGGKP